MHAHTHTLTWLYDGRRRLQVYPRMTDGGLVKFGNEGDVNRPVTGIGHKQLLALWYRELDVTELELSGVEVHLREGVVLQLVQFPGNLLQSQSLFIGIHDFNLELRG